MSSKTKKQLTSQKYNEAHRDELRKKALYNYYKKLYGEETITNAGGLDNLRFTMKKEKLRIKREILKKSLFEYIKENPNDLKENP
jgi:hypothetical protein